MAENRDALIGPIQFMTVLLHTPSWEGQIADEFLRLEADGLITIIDVAIVSRTSEDEFDLIARKNPLDFLRKGPVEEKPETP